MPEPCRTRRLWAMPPPPERVMMQAVRLPTSTEKHKNMKRYKADLLRGVKARHVVGRTHGFKLSGIRAVSCSPGFDAISGNPDLSCVLRRGGHGVALPNPSRRSMPTGPVPVQMCNQRPFDDPASFRCDSCSEPATGHASASYNASTTDLPEAGGSSPCEARPNRCNATLAPFLESPAQVSCFGAHKLPRPNQRLQRWGPDCRRRLSTSIRPRAPCPTGYR